MINKYCILGSFLIYLPLMVIGGVFYEDRLVVLDVSINTIMFFLSVMLVYISYYPRYFIFRSKMTLCLSGVIIIIPILILSSNANFQGMEKYLNSLFLGLLGYLIVINAINYSLKEYILKLSILFILVLFVAAVIWKLKYGFWLRHINYFMNGPIVFGRNMAVGFFLTAIFLPFGKKINIILLLIFFFGVLWSMSKGPIIALAASSLYFLYQKNKPSFLLLVVSIFISMLFLLYTSIDLSDTPLHRIQIGFQALLGISNSSSAAGSVGIRSEMIADTIMIINGNLILGIGAGNWQSVLNYPFTYPHNIFIEVFSDLGIIFGAILLLPYIGFLVRPTNKIFVLPLFFLISHQVSGDISDARWLLLFSLLSFGVNKKYFE
ncbi:O-antigen ligase family protein [Vibrio sp. 1F255]|uniref:O-antigen ligase family protein n=1 Tax=Vibrio sp. 1F255 TaxID=3230009 RepID=UPI00352D9D52